MDFVQNIIGAAGGANALGGFSPFDHNNASSQYQQAYLSEHEHHKSSLTHEAIAGAAGFAAMHAYESHLRASGQPVSHEKMKEILAAIAAAEVDKLAETKGLDWLDREKAKHMARHQADELARQRYGEGNTGYEYAQSVGGPAVAYNFGGGAPYGAQGCPNYGWYGQQYGAGPGYGGPPAPGYGPPGGGYYPPPPQGYGGYGGPPPQGYYSGPPGQDFGGDGGDGGHHHHHHHHD